MSDMLAKGDVKAMIDILTGDARLVLPTLPDNHFHACVTSPPYFGLRDYGNPDQMGLVAKQENRTATLIELNPDYAAMALARIDAEEVQSEMFG